MIADVPKMRAVIQGDVEDEGLELLDDAYSKTTLKDEQQQRLLSEEEEEEGSGDIVAEAARSTRRPWTWRIWLAICTCLLAGSLTIALFFMGLGQEMEEAQHEVDDALRVQTSDYILDSKRDIGGPPQRREYDWVIRDQVHNPDGIFRPMILVNNMFPGPLIEANEGDTIVVHVENRAVNATSIHWHGLYQNGTPHMDGTVGVTQCPIAPGSKFTYEFTINGQHGTTWWHGHQGVQTSDGLHGPIVIHGREEKRLQSLQYDSDRVILLSDHYYDLSSALLFQYLMPDVENAEPVPDTALINGRGVRNCDDFPHRKCDNSTSNIGRLNVVLERNRSHRLRIINVGAFAEFQFQIDEHELAVTEVDGTDVHPQSVHRLNINPAQRYSVIITSNATSVETFWMRARMITSCFTDPPATLQADALAIVRYSNDMAAKEPTSQDWGEKLALECRDMNTTTMIPVEAIAAPTEPDAVFYLRSNFEIGAYRLSRGFFNQSSWRANARTPTLLRAIEGLKAGNTSFAKQNDGTSENGVTSAFVNSDAFEIEREMVIQTTGIQTIDILVSNFDDGNHPLHLHGYKYFVLAQGHGAPPLTSLDAAINRESLSPLYESINTTNPLRRDTASVEAYGWILLRLVADNPGVWAFHCHVSWHTEAGLLMQFLTRTDELAKMQVPQSSLALCSADGLEKGMTPEDVIYEDFAK